MADTNGTGKGGGTIVVRRPKKGGHGGHHGGAWKIAYADFVTAMMAFFLLMWLLGSTTKADKQGIEDYFNTPLAVALSGNANGGSQSSVLNAGGRDIASTEKGDGHATQTQRGAQSGTVQAVTPAQTAPRMVKTTEDDLGRLTALKVKLATLIEQSPRLRVFKDQIRISITSEGLRIEIIDTQNRPMFKTGSSRLESYAQDILREIGAPLNDVDNRVSIAGHTDAAPYQGGETGYSNWELSSERANAARRELAAGGMKEDKVLQVRGLADVLPLNRNGPDQASNRRISILVLNRATEDAFFHDGGRVAAEADVAASAIRDGVASGVKARP
jgi:chemotaxis protein MotB